MTWSLSWAQNCCVSFAFGAISLMPMLPSKVWETYTRPTLTRSSPPGKEPWFSRQRAASALRNSSSSWGLPARFWKNWNVLWRSHPFAWRSFVRWCNFMLRSTQHCCTCRWIRAPDVNSSSTEYVTPAGRARTGLPAHVCLCLVHKPALHVHPCEASVSAVVSKGWFSSLQGWSDIVITTCGEPYFDLVVRFWTISPISPEIPWFCSIAPKHPKLLCIAISKSIYGFHADGFAATPSLLGDFAPLKKFLFQGCIPPSLPSWIGSFLLWVHNVMHDDLWTMDDVSTLEIVSTCTLRTCGCGQQESMAPATAGFWRVCSWNPASATASWNQNLFVGIANLQLAFTSDSPDCLYLPQIDNIWRLISRSWPIICCNLRRMVTISQLRATRSHNLPRIVTEAGLEHFRSNSFESKNCQQGSLQRQDIESAALCQALISWHEAASLDFLSICLVDEIQCREDSSWGKGTWCYLFKRIDWHIDRYEILEQKSKAALRLRMWPLVQRSANNPGFPDKGHNVISLNMDKKSVSRSQKRPYVCACDHLCSVQQTTLVFPTKGWLSTSQ